LSFYQLALLEIKDLSFLNKNVPSATINPTNKKGYTIGLGIELNQN